MWEVEQGLEYSTFQGRPINYRVRDKVQNIQKSMSRIKLAYGGCNNLPKAQNIPPNTASHATFNERLLSYGEDT